MQRSFGLHTIKRLRTSRESALQSLARISLRDELMRHKTLEAGVRNCGQNGGVVQFLAGVQIVAARIATSVKVRDRSDCTLHRADHVALHNLHVIDVVQQAHVRGACQRAHLQSPGGVVSLISRVVHAAVTQLQQQRYAGCP